MRIAGHAIDIRMSTIPSAHGERVVLRLLDKQAGQLDLVQLKMNAQVGDGYALHWPDRMASFWSRAPLALVRPRRCMQGYRASIRARAIS